MYRRQYSEPITHGCLINPQLPSGPVHPYQLDKSISNFRAVWCTYSFLFYFEYIFLLAKGEDPDQTPHSAVSDLGLHCLPMSQNWDARLIWVKYDLSCDITKPTKSVCAQRRFRSAWASTQYDQSLLCAQRVAKDPSHLHADSEDSDQTGRMHRLIWVFAGSTLILLVLSCPGSFGLPLKQFQPLNGV